MSRLLVQGICPACGSRSLMVDYGGKIVCALIACPDPVAAHRLLEDPPATPTVTPK